MTHGHKTETSAPVSIHLSPLWFSSFTLGRTTPLFLIPASPAPAPNAAAEVNPNPVPSVDLPCPEYNVSPPIVGVDAAAGPPWDLSRPFSDELLAWAEFRFGKIPNIPRSWSLSPAANEEAESRLLRRFRRRRQRRRAMSRPSSWTLVVFWSAGDAASGGSKRRDVEKAKCRGGGK